jgi:hypothetical protein
MAAMQRSEPFLLGRLVVALAVCSAAATAVAQQSEGGVYIAGDGFSFAQAAGQALDQNTGGQRFYVLALPPESEALTTSATTQNAALRARIVAAGGVLYVCQRDIADGKVDAGRLVPGVIAVRGWPRLGSAAMPPDARYFPGENPANLPVANHLLHQIRNACEE